MRQSFYNFLKNNSYAYQNQAMFEFRYPVLFEEDSFMIDQLNFPKLDTNIGNVYLDGYKIPVHSTALFDNEITFTMYVDERDLRKNGKYFQIFNSILEPEHFLKGIKQSSGIATIIPISTTFETYEAGGKDENDRTIILYNALIKSISLQGGFSSNSIATLKYDIAMTYSFFKHVDDDTFDK